MTDILIRILIAAIVGLAVYIGASIRPSGIYEPIDHHRNQEVYTP